MLKKLFTGVILSTSLALTAQAESPPLPVQQFAEVLKQQYQKPYSISSIGDGKSFWQISLGGNTVFVTPDGNYVVYGSLFDVAKGVDHAETAKLDNTVNVLKSLNPKSLVRYPSNSEKANIWVFSDTHCPHCREFHSQIPELNKNGVSVNYIPFPLQGLKSNGFETNTAILCSNSPAKAFESVIKVGNHVEGDDKCADLVKDGVRAAELIGVNSTPSIVLPNGMIGRGAYSAEEIIAALKDIEKGHGK